MKYVSSYLDRHGKQRWRFRKTGCKPQMFKAACGTAEFAREYEAYLQTPSVPPEPLPELPTLSLTRQLRGDLKGGYVYFIEAENGLIKIGYSASVRERFKKLSTAVPMQLTVLGLCPAEPHVERELHERFSGQRAMGEWFRPSPELLNLARGSNGEQRLTVLTNP